MTLSSEFTKIGVTIGIISAISLLVSACVREGKPQFGTIFEKVVGVGIIFGFCLAGIGAVCLIWE